MIQTIKKLRRLLLVWLTHGIALPVLKLTRKKRLFPYTDAALRAMPPGTIGKDLVTLLDARQLQLLPYYEKHDIKHLVLGFDMTEKGEACLQCYMLGNGRVSFPVLATVAYAFFTMPEYWKAMRQAYRKGRRCVPVHQWNWFALIPQQTAAVSIKALQPRNA